jgi:flagellar hook assembly protein FlgD
MTDQIASASITLYDIRGRLLRQINLSPTESTCVLTHTWDFTTADGTALPKGIYIARCILTTADGQTLSQNTKIVRN